MERNIKIFYLIFLLKIFALMVHGQDQEEDQEELPSRPIRLGHYRVNKEFITLSGFSSGGGFAQIFYFSHSSRIQGIGVISHTYYRCGPVSSSQEIYDEACTSLGNHSRLYNYRNVFRDIEYYVSHGLIDKPSNMHNKPLYNYVSTANWLFSPEQQLKIQDIFLPYIGTHKTIRTVYQHANLTLPTDDPEYPPCSAPPNKILVSSCGYSAPFEALQFLLGPNAVRPPQHVHHLEPLLAFDQSEFLYGLDENRDYITRFDMDDIGYLYVPKVCQDGRTECLLHFYFHGCNVGREFVGSAHIRHSGYLEIAEANGIIMVFPQAVSSAENDIGCWDTYGFTGPFYATKRGAQVIAVKHMLRRIIDDPHKEKSSAPILNDNVDKGVQYQYQPTSSSFQPTARVVSDYVSRFLQPHSHIFKELENYRHL